MLSVVNEMATSGALPPRMAWVILSSSWLPTFLMVMFGCAAWNLSRADPSPASSRSAKSLQTVIVTFLSLGGGAAAWVELVDPTPLQAVAVSVTASPSTTAVVAFFIVSPVPSIFSWGMMKSVSNASCRQGGYARLLYFREESDVGSATTEPLSKALSLARERATRSAPESAASSVIG